MSRFASRLQRAAAHKKASGSFSFPDETNTGVERLGLSLTDYTGYGAFNALAVFDSTAFRSTNMGNEYIRIDAGGDFTATKSYFNCRIDCDGANRAVTLEDCTLDGSGGHLGVGYNNLTLRRCNIFNAIICVNTASDILIEDCYIHHPYLPEGAPDHINPFFNGGGTNITIRRSTFWAPIPDNDNGGGVTTNLSFFGDFDVVRNVLVEDCYIRWTHGAYGVTLGHNPGKPYGDNPQNVIFRNNTFERGPSGRNAVYGPVTGFLNANGNQFYGNKYEDGELITA